jgi:hypothetical protein
VAGAEEDAVGQHQVPDLPPRGARERPAGCGARALRAPTCPCARTCVEKEAAKRASAATHPPMKHVSLSPKRWIEYLPPSSAQASCAPPCRRRCAPGQGLHPPTTAVISMTPVEMDPTAARSVMLVSGNSWTNAARNTPYVYCQGQPRDWASVCPFQERRARTQARTGGTFRARHAPAVPRR